MNLLLANFYLFPYSLACFDLLFAKCFCFRFAKGLTVGFVIGKAEFNDANITISFSG